MEADNVNINVFSEQVFVDFCNNFPSIISFKMYPCMLSVNEFRHLMCRHMQEINVKVYAESSNTNVSYIFSSLKELPNLHRLNLYIGYKNCTMDSILAGGVPWSKAQIIKICSNCIINLREQKCMFHSN